MLNHIERVRKRVSLIESMAFQMTQAVLVIVSLTHGNTHDAHSFHDVLHAHYPIHVSIPIPLIILTVAQSHRAIIIKYQSCFLSSSSHLCPFDPASSEVSGVSYPSLLAGFERSIAVDCSSSSTSVEALEVGMLGLDMARSLTLFERRAWMVSGADCESLTPLE